jgi:hypothetical protein
VARREIGRIAAVPAKRPFGMRQRATRLPAEFPGDGDRTPLDLDPVIDDFAAWFAARRGSWPEGENIGVLADSWSGVRGPFSYACSPHRIEHTATLISNMYQEEHARAALDLLPDWAEWCVERSGLQGQLADRARVAVRNNRPDGADSVGLRRVE